MILKKPYTNYYSFSFSLALIFVINTLMQFLIQRHCADKSQQETAASPHHPKNVPHPNSSAELTEMLEFVGDGIVDMMDDIAEIKHIVEALSNLQTNMKESRRLTSELSRLVSRYVCSAYIVRITWSG